MRGNERKHAHQFNLFAEISSSEDDEAELEREQRGMNPQQILDKSPRYADSFLDKCKALLQDTNESVIALQKDIATKTEQHAREEQGKVAEETTTEEKIVDIEQLKKEELDLHTQC